MKKTMMEKSAPYAHKPFQALNLCDDFLFTKTMQDPDILKPILEAILNFKISQVKIADAQKSFDVSYDSHGIRLDVYADDTENSRFAVEMQARQEYNLFKRSRYYHSVMDIDELLKGQSYDKLRNNYVIFICTFHPFSGSPHSQLHQYNLRSTCRQAPELPFDEGRETIFLSTEGTADDISPDLQAFLHYVKSSTDETADQLDNDLIRKIHDKVKRIKQNRQMEVEYLKFEELLKESRADGFSEGIEQGRSEGIELGRSEGIFALISVLSDMNFSEEQIKDELVKRFSLSKDSAADYYKKYC